MEICFNGGRFYRFQATRVRSHYMFYDMQHLIPRHVTLQSESLVCMLRFHAWCACSFACLVPMHGMPACRSRTSSSAAPMHLHLQRSSQGPPSSSDDGLSLQAIMIAGLVQAMKVPHLMQASVMMLFLMVLAYGGALVL